MRVWVVEGVLAPIGASPQEWRFTGASLRRARLALTLTRELEINAPGVALALDLMDEIAALRASLRRAGKPDRHAAPKPPSASDEAQVALAGVVVGEVGQHRQQVGVADAEPLAERRRVLVDRGARQQAALAHVVGPSLATAGAVP